LQGSEDPHVKWLEFVSYFRGEVVKDDGGWWCSRATAFQGFHAMHDHQ